MATSFIGIDLGRSAVKVVARQGDRTISFMFPSAVTKAQAVVFDQLVERASRDTVELRGETYWTGDTSLMQNWGSDPVGRNDDWVSGVQHDVLVASALKRLEAEGLEYDPADAFITLGVPSRVFRDRRDLLRAVRENSAAVLARDGVAPKVSVQAQPIGVIACHTLTADGYSQPGRSLEKDSYAVVEIGQFTTDFTAVVKGLPIIEATASCEGVELVVGHIRSKLREEGITLGNVDLQTLITQKSIRVRGQDRDLSDLIDQGIKLVLLPKIMETLKVSFNPVLLQSVDQVLVAGGGAPLVYPVLKEMPHVSHAFMVENPRNAVSDGFARLSALMVLADMAAA